MARAASEDLGLEVCEPRVKANSWNTVKVTDVQVDYSHRASQKEMV